MKIEQPENQEIIDVHCHFFAGQGQAEMVAGGLARLREAGVRHLAVMGLVNSSLNAQNVWKLIPEGFDNLGDPLFNEADDLLQFTQQNGDMLFPMLDTRMLNGDVQSFIKDHLQRGFRGIKDSIWLMVAMIYVSPAYPKPSASALSSIINANGRSSPLPKPTICRSSITWMPIATAI